jgi:hypothetical protein
LAVLRLGSSFSTTLFFDDTDSTENQFLGFVTFTGSVVLMEPTFHARFITDNQHENAYLCNGKTGIIEKQFHWNLKNNSPKESISIDPDDINLPIIENSIELQINSFMQLEYHNSTNINFSFACQNEQFQYQFGVPLPIKPTSFMDLTTKILATKQIPEVKNFQTKTRLLIKSFKSINSNDISNSSEKSQKLLDRQINFHQFSIPQELILLRKRIRNICDSWLKEYRTTLG